MGVAIWRAFLCSRPRPSTNEYLGLQCFNVYILQCGFCVVAYTSCPTTEIIHRTLWTRFVQLHIDEIFAFAVASYWHEPGRGSC